MQHEAEEREAGSTESRGNDKADVNEKADASDTESATMQAEKIFFILLILQKKAIKDY